MTWVSRLASVALCHLRPPGHNDNITAPVTDLAARIRRRKILGGPIREYEWAA